MILGRAGMAAGGGVAIAAGLFIGVMYGPAPTRSNLLVMLQPAPLQILSHAWSQDD